jgi:hypothetical protein
MISNRHDHAAVLRTSGATAASSDDRATSIAEGIARLGCAETSGEQAAPAALPANTRAQQMF